MPTVLSRNWVQILASALFVGFCVATWVCFTAWGVLAASVGAQIGRIPEQALAETRSRAQMLFGLIVLCQVAMLASAIWFVGAKRFAASTWQAFRQPTNWIWGAGLTLFTDALVFAGLFWRQVNVGGR